MSNKPQMTNPPDPAAIKAYLEAVTGRKFDASVINLFFWLGQGVGTTGGSDYPSSFVTWKDLVYDSVTHTSVMPLLDVSGSSFTGADGNAVFRVTTFAGSEIDALEPVHIVATPLGGAPVFLTVDYVLVTADIEITVHSWNPDGSPAPNILFHFRCRTAAQPDL